MNLIGSGYVPLGDTNRRKAIMDNAANVGKSPIKPGAYPDAHRSPVNIGKSIIKPGPYPDAQRSKLGNVLRR